MSQRIVIHFNSLADFLLELGPADNQHDPIVRVTVTQRTVQKSTLPIATVTVATDVRAVTFSGISNYRPYEESMELMHHDPEGAQRINRAWHAADAVASQVRIHLAEMGYTIRAGVVDLGDVLPVPGDPWVLEG